MPYIGSLSRFADNRQTTIRILNLAKVFSTCTLNYLKKLRNRPSWPYFLREISQKAIIFVNISEPLWVFGLRFRNPRWPYKIQQNDKKTVLLIHNFILKYLLFWWFVMLHLDNILIFLWKWIWHKNLFTKAWDKFIVSCYRFICMQNFIGKVFWQNNWDNFIWKWNWNVSNKNALLANEHVT